MDCEQVTGQARGFSELFVGMNNEGVERSQDTAV
jgi:hypothetical protein